MENVGLNPETPETVHGTVVGKCFVSCGLIMHWIISLLFILCGIFYDIWKYCYNLLKRLVFAPLCWWLWTIHSRHVCSNVALCRNHSFVEELLERQQDSITYLTERCQHLTELLLTHPSGLHMSPGSSIYDLSASVMSSSAMITDWWPEACKFIRWPVSGYWQSVVQHTAYSSTSRNNCLLHWNESKSHYLLVTCNAVVIHVCLCTSVYLQNQCFFVTVRAGTAYRKIWRLDNSFFACIIRLTVQKF